MRRKPLDYDPAICADLLREIQSSIIPAKSCGERALSAIHSGYVEEAGRLARLAARHGLRWRSAWLEHNERLEGVVRRDAGACWGAL